ncbi:hypothetical protein DICVIV_07019 [Dictyocaulus viviparus]|uniref:Uncharacterized protein n=1 Tax=Dictyocaulus viviparus TaxID=29172 RepID=A0A0D8XT51_DICVI|nr:hypothetical protein DICVIV_07019 [Dictyocaulus viviparus]
MTISHEILSHLAGQSVDSPHYRKFLIDRRKSYRNRSLGATIASAPSVEQENYRTPKPSFDKNGGKSFDCCGPTGSLASDSNGLVRVSLSKQFSVIQLEEYCV